MPKSYTKASTETSSRSTNKLPIRKPNPKARRGSRQVNPKRQSTNEFVFLNVRRVQRLTSNQVSSLVQKRQIVTQKECYISNLKNSNSSSFSTGCVVSKKVRQSRWHKLKATVIFEIKILKPTLLNYNVMIVKSKNYVFIFSLVLSSKMATNEAPRVELESLLDTDKSNLKQIVCLKVII